MRAYVGCVGCEQRQLDAERVRQYLLANGFELVETVETSDVAVVVTCAVDQSNEAESLQAVHDVLAHAHKTTKVIVGGCLPSISPHLIDNKPIAATFSPRTLDILDDYIDVSSVKMKDIAEPHRTTFDRPKSGGLEQLSPRAAYDAAKHGFKIRINHGCLLSCAYCVILKATARLKSVPEEDIVSTFCDAVNTGEPTIMLMGGDTGAYGLDLGSNFAVLLGRLMQVPGKHQVYIHDWNVNWLLRDLSDFISVLQSGVANIAGICFPVQSGSDLILKKMRRPYTSEAVIRGLRCIKEHVPHVALGTHIIAGFPGETADDFFDTITLIEAVEFDFVTCFRYSEHRSAPAARYADTVSEEVKAERLTTLHELLGDRATILR